MGLHPIGSGWVVTQGSAMNPNAKCYFIGGGIGSMAAAAFLIRDGDVSGENIFILEANALMGAVWMGRATLSMVTRCGVDGC